MRLLRMAWYRWVLAGRYVPVERFRQEHRATIAACARATALREWIEDKRHAATDRPNYRRIADEAWDFAMRCVPQGDERT